GKQVFLSLDGIQKYCKVWINGAYIGDHYGFGSFDFNVTSLLKSNADNVIAMAVSNSRKISGSDYGGITGDVRIILKNKLYIPMQGSSSHEGGTSISTPGFNGKTGVVNIFTWVQNDNPVLKNCTLKTTVYDAEGKSIQVLKTIAEIKPGELYRFEQVSKQIKNLQLWSPEQPYMYRVYSEVYDGAMLCDTYTSTLGFRWFRWDKTDNSLYLNGKKTVLSGIELIYQDEMLGNAVPSWLIEKNLKDMSKGKTINYVRTSDNKYINMADRMGLIVDASLPFDEKDTKEVYDNLVKELIRKNRNNPSVLFWNLGLPFKSSEPSIVLAEDSTRIFIPQNQKVRSTDPDKFMISSMKGFADPSESSKTIAGEPVRVVVTSEQHSLNAGRGSVAKVEAIIVDAQGNKVEGSGKVLRWNISGPARLTGPEISLPESSSSHDNNVLRYSTLPAINIIRSTGESGKISIIVSASGLMSGSLDILSVPLTVDNSLVSETILKNEGRRRSDRNVLAAERLENIPEEIKYLSADLKLNSTDVNGYKKAISEHIVRNNLDVDTSTVEFRTFASLLGRYMDNNKGRIAVVDFNFNAMNYNNCRLISSYVNATKLPQQFKDALRQFYSNAIIWQGEPKNAGDEMNWLNWIPSGGTVVICSDEMKLPPAKGVIITDKNKLTDIISIVHPAFTGFSADARERAMDFITKMNPYVFKNQKGGNDKESAIILAEKGKPVLIPLLKFISED
ncbi:MAG TPA: hypothetical protein VHO50_12980, partial [Bacteroidales bacterium]|nr:hypothetical protein [Bacteroidales bacterium]